MNELQEHQLAQDCVGDYLVSTITLDRPELRALDKTVGFLGDFADALDADVPERPGAETDPLAYRYETMVFRQAGGVVIDWGELACERYQTEDEARAGHAALVEEWGAKAGAKA